MKKLIAFLLTTVLLVSAVTTAYATAPSETESVIQPRWTYLDTVSAYLNINFLGIATCEGSATAHVLQDVDVIVRLQQLTDTGWSTIKTWSSTSTGSATASGKYAVYSGYSYRTTVTGYVYDDNGNIVETGNASDSFDY